MRNHVGSRPSPRTEAEKLHLFSIIDEHSANGIWIIDGEGKTCWTNRTGREFYNLTEEETIGVPVSEFERRGIFRPAASLIALRKHAPVTVTHQTNCGRVTLASANPLMDDDGRVSMVIVAVTDISNMPLPPSGRSSARVGIDASIAAIPASRRLVHRSAAMNKVIGEAIRVAAADCPVLISGETGVGKTEVAKIIHAHSHRRQGPFVSVDCGALPASLIESELFGHASGAFTGASRRGKPGLIQSADKGTLLLDEISELPLDLQVKLLRVLEERRFRPVGDTSERMVDFRVVAASNRDLRKLSETGRFRSDLYYRLAVITIDVPPLRDRPEDIVPIAQAHLLSVGEKRCNRLALSNETIRPLESYDWPGNVRELRNLVESFAVLVDGPAVGLNDLPDHIRKMEHFPTRIHELPSSNLPKLREAVRAFERELAMRAIEQAGSHERAADLLGISLPTLMRKKRRAAIKADLDDQN
jgi:transcriptional regulator with PAS, ATPase and Fis domain